MNRTRAINFLQFIALIHVLVGVVLPLYAYSDFFYAYSNLIRDAFWQTQMQPTAAIDFERWIIALFGPTVASWGVLLFTLTCYSKKIPSLKPWLGILAATAIWGALDIGISMSKGFYMHLVIDLLAIAAIVVPTAYLFRLDKNEQ
jgi:hypothetical protein